ncbi:hypothetical protein BGZ94_003714, partial [Podila epigama]
VVKKENKNKNVAKTKKNKGTKKLKNDTKNSQRKITNDFHISAVGDIVCGGSLNVICPDDRPCCSQWGFCGKGLEYCGQGCQSQSGRCGDIAEEGGVDDNTPNEQAAAIAGGAAGAGRKSHKRKGKRRKKHQRTNPYGFDLQQRIRKSGNSQEGLALRIPTSVPKLPGSGTLVNIAYFPGWTQYRGQGRNNCRQRPYLPQDIPWSSLDYVMFAFVYFGEDNELYPADPSDEDLYFAINRLKQPTKTRVVVSIGGWSFTHPENQQAEGTRHRFSNMIRSAESRAQFIASCIEFVKFYGFDGIDIDYEYPTFHDREFVTSLFREMRAAFNAEGSGLVLTMAGASFAEGVQGFDLDKIAEYVDFMMIMSYDLYGAYDTSHIVNIHTTLFQMPTETHGGHSVQGAVEMYLDRGVPREKLVLGLALYGKTYLLADPQNSTPGRARFSAGGDPTSCIETRGDIAYNEIAPLFYAPNAIHPSWDMDSKAFYFVYGNQRNNWVGYDDRPSIDLKLQMVVEQDLAGIMWWSLDQDLDDASQDPSHPIRKRSEAIEALEASEAVELGRRAIPQAPFHRPESAADGKAKDTLSNVEKVVPSSLHRPKTHLSDGSIESKQEFIPQEPSTTGNSGSCPSLSAEAPPDYLATIPFESLGKPGLVPYVASKRKRCNAVVEYPHVLPPAPVGNIVMTKCIVPDGVSSCPESWQAYKCLPEGWSAPSPCFDRDVQESSASNVKPGKDAAGTDTDKQGHGRGGEQGKLGALIGSKRPKYINEAQKMQLHKQLLKSIQEKMIRKKNKEQKNKKNGENKKEKEEKSKEKKQGVSQKNMHMKKKKKTTKMTAQKELK